MYKEPDIIKNIINSNKRWQWCFHLFSYFTNVNPNLTITVTYISMNLLWIAMYFKFLLETAIGRFLEVGFVAQFLQEFSKSDTYVSCV